MDEQLELAIWSVLNGDWRWVLKHVEPEICQEFVDDLVVAVKEAAGWE